VDFFDWFELVILVLTLHDLEHILVVPLEMLRQVGPDAYLLTSEAPTDLL
jgi:hypothetical protein